MDKLAAQIQALLFSEGGALTFKSLAKSLECSEADLRPALDALQTLLEGSGLSLVCSDTEASLVVAAEARGAIQKKMAEEYERDIGDAGLEVLAVLLYEGPSTRATIDYIRGVNSSSTLRNLLARGLVERSGNPEDGREFIYRGTTELLAHLGTTGRDKLPEYGTISAELASFKATQNHGSAESGNETFGGSNSA
ncbi:MAG: SMC-Scp complex subunit ScpB [Minisyncoccia bacterium]